MHASAPWTTPDSHLRRTQPDAPVLYFAPKVLQATARRFLTGFPGLVTYAVKANPDPAVLANLWAAGVTTFDVASPAEIAAVREIAPNAVLHYNNPVRSRAEIEVARSYGVASWSLDDATELDKLVDLPTATEIAVRLKLPVEGAAYDFGSKFGATPDCAVALLRAVAARGLTPAMCFHPGTQCASPEAWGAYIVSCTQVARAAGVRLARLNVGGGFAAHRAATAPDLQAIFDHIRKEVARVAGPEAPALLCEPGRAMVADCMSLATRVKAVRADGTVFLNDGIYGALAEARDIGAVARFRAQASDGTARRGARSARVVFGPTCDSIDRLPDPLELPDDLKEGDYIVFDGMGAYSSTLATRFNGFGPDAPVTVDRLT
ncbi:MAG: type III PLP-dependent enzyme [Pseudomonadota bacterium]